MGSEKEGHTRELASFASLDRPVQLNILRRVGALERGRVSCASKACRAAVADKSFWPDVVVPPTTLDARGTERDLRDVCDAALAHGGARSLDVSASDLPWPVILRVAATQRMALQRVALPCAPLSEKGRRSSAAELVAVFDEERAVCPYAPKAGGGR